VGLETVSARDAILERVRAATRAAAAPPVAQHDYRRAGSLTPAERSDLFCERVGDYRAEVRRIAAADIAAEIDAVLASRAVRAVVVPAGLDPGWRPASVEIVADTGLSAAELDRLGAVVTGCTVAIAETGTIVLTAAPDEGRRVLTLVPDLHVCVVEEARIVELVPEAMGQLAALVRAERRPVTFVSGPSATSDIELSRVEGVHGPRDLVVLVVRANPS
jgi:L-lactate dehydrogenase complex protein LldG